MLLDTIKIPERTLQGKQHERLIFFVLLTLRLKRAAVEGYVGNEHRLFAASWSTAYPCPNGPQNIDTDAYLLHIDKVRLRVSK